MEEPVSVLPAGKLLMSPRLDLINKHASQMKKKSFEIKGAKNHG